MENISDQALQAFLRTKIDLFEKRVRGVGFTNANTRVQAAKDFVAFVFGGRPGRQRRPPRRRRPST